MNTIPKNYTGHSATHQPITQSGFTANTWAGPTPPSEQLAKGATPLNGANRWPKATAAAACAFSRPVKKKPLPLLHKGSSSEVTPKERAKQNWRNLANRAIQPTYFFRGFDINHRAEGLNSPMLRDLKRMGVPHPEQHVHRSIDWLYQTPANVHAGLKRHAEDSNALVAPGLYSNKSPWLSLTTDESIARRAGLGAMANQDRAKGVLLLAKVHAGQVIKQSTERYYEKEWLLSTGLNLKDVVSVNIISK